MMGGAIGLGEVDWPGIRTANAPGAPSAPSATSRHLSCHRLDRCEGREGRGIPLRTALVH